MPQIFQLSFRQVAHNSACYFTATLLVLLTCFPGYAQQKSKSRQSGDSKENADASLINMIFTSDVHYGITKHTFRGDSTVASYKVNDAMIRQMNTLPGLTLPQDSGTGAGSRITAIDYVIETGDITNRMQIPGQTATTSWAQFETGYLQHLRVKGRDGQRARLLLLPGNHDAANAIGYYKPMQPLTDPASMVHIYNLMMQQAVPLTNATYNYTRDKINYSRNVGGVHLQFIQMWPDSAARIWMAKDLDTVPSTTPVIIFSHVQPQGDPYHFRNPHSPDKVRADSKFENLNTEIYKDSIDTTKPAAVLSTAMEQRGWVVFLKAHPNIKAYFHGHNNWTEFYTYDGPDHDVNLQVYRVDSPMKGKYSALDETLLSFQLITLDPVKQKLTVRECLWNTAPKNQQQKIVFGKKSTLSLRIR